MSTLEFIREEICFNAHLQDKLTALPMDSLEYLNLIVSLEEKTNISIPHGSIGAFHTVNDLVEFFGA